MKTAFPLEPFKGLLLGLFFVTVGVSVDWFLVSQHLVRVVLGVVILLAVKFGLLYLLGRAAGRLDGEQLKQALAGLAPALNDPSRGTYYRWLFFGAGCFEPALLDEMMKRPPPPQKAAVGWGSYGEVVSTLKSALAKGPYLLGDKFSAADVYVGSGIRWAMTFGAPGLKGEKTFDDYVARLNARPALQRTSG